MAGLHHNTALGLGLGDRFGARRGLLKVPQRRVQLAEKAVDSQAKRAAKRLSTSHSQRDDGNEGVDGSSPSEAFEIRAKRAIRKSTSPASCTTTGAS
jgi:hypothetical protein